MPDRRRAHPEKVSPAAGDTLVTAAADGRAKRAADTVPKLAATLLGLLLLALAGFASYNSDYVFAAYWKVFVRLPGMLPGQYYFFPVWWVLTVLPAALFGLGFIFPAFRQALRASWRQPRAVLPVLAAFAVFALTMIPAEFYTTPTGDTGTKMVFYLVVAGTGTVLFLAGFSDKLRFLDEPMRRLEGWVMNLDRRLFMLLLFGFTFAVANLTSWLVFAHMPHIQDSVAQVFQARIFATGRLCLESPRFPDFFDYTHIINNGRWYSQYLFLHSLLLMLGVFIGAPWVINPLLGGLTIPLVYLLGRELHGERTGRLAGVLACFSPFIFDMSAEYMNHSSALLFATLFLLFYFRTLKRGIRGFAPGKQGQPPISADRKSDGSPHIPALDAGGWHQPLVAGVALGLVANVRPYTALALAAPLALYGLYRIVREPGRYLPRFLLMAAAAGAVTSMVFVYNWLVNGDPMLWGYVVKWGPGHEVGFGKSGWGAMHTPYRGLVNTLQTLNQTNKFLFEWPVPAAIPILALFAAGRRGRADWLPAAVFLSLLLAFFFYWFQNTRFGPRFMYESAACLVILTVRGAGQFGQFLRRRFGLAVSDESAATFVRRAWPVLTALAVGVGLPPLFRTFRSYNDVEPTTARTVERAGVKNAVVFLYHLGHGFSFNTLDLGGDIVYAKDYGLLNAALTLSYPDRQYYYANRDTLRALTDIAFPRSRLRQALGEMAGFLGDTLSAGYRTVIWPFADIPLPGVGPGPRVLDPREISRAIFTGRYKLDDYLPALACWLINDEREHLRVFSFMNDLQNVIAGGYKFTLLMVTSDGTAAVYDISTATGDEVTVPGQASPVPVR